MEETYTNISHLRTINNTVTHLLTKLVIIEIESPPRDYCKQLHMYRYRTYSMYSVHWLGKYEPCMTSVEMAMGRSFRASSARIVVHQHNSALSIIFVTVSMP